MEYGGFSELSTTTGTLGDYTADVLPVSTDVNRGIVGACGGSASI